MPAIPKNERQPALDLALDEAKHKCFRHYHALMKMWREDTHWSTIDTFAKRIWSDDEQRAAALALIVFFGRHGFKYEDDRFKENGDI